MLTWFFYLSFFSFFFCLEIAEQGYTKVQSELQKAVLKGYDKKRRPVLYQYTPTYVNAFVHLTHISVDQREQTLTLAGIITMVCQFFKYNISQKNFLVDNNQIW